MATLRTATGVPTTKVIGATLGATLSALTIWALKEAAGITLDEGVQVVITMVFTLLAGYVTPPAPRDAVIPKQIRTDNHGSSGKRRPPSVIPEQRMKLALSRPSNRAPSR